MVQSTFLRTNSNRFKPWKEAPCVFVGSVVVVLSYGEDIQLFRDDEKKL